MARYRVSGITIGIFGAIIFFLVPSQVDSVESAVFPRAISVCLVICGILLAVPSWKQERQQLIRLLDPFLLACLLLVFAAVLMVQYIGFYPAILLILPSFLLLFGERNYLKIGLFTLITMGVIYLILDLILGSNLP